MNPFIPKHLVLAASVALATTLGCSLTEPSPQRYRGHYVNGFESSSFKACDDDEFWWMQFPAGAASRALDSALVAGRANATPQNPYPVVHLYLEVSGTLNGPGQYGHLGVSTHELTVDGIVVVGAWSEAACN